MQVCALPLAYYREHKDNIPWDTIHDCKTITTTTTTNKDGTPLDVEAILSCRDFGHMETDGFISFPHGVEVAQGIEASQALAPNGVRLPEVLFPKRSAEALLEGKRPQLVLVVRAVHAHNGAPLTAIRPAASTPFHVATRRTRGNEKAYIPSMDQEVRPCIPRASPPRPRPPRLPCGQCMPLGACLPPFQVTRWRCTATLASDCSGPR